MSDFLSRLVQRTRGEAATVRPVAGVVTAPDSGALAWDERVIEHESPLAVSPHAPSRPLLQRAHAVPAPAVAATMAATSSTPSTARFAAGEERTDADQAAALPTPAAHRSSRPAARRAAPLQDAAAVAHDVAAPSAQLAPVESSHPAAPSAAQTASAGLAPSLVEASELALSAAPPGRTPERPMPTPARALAGLPAVDHGAQAEKARAPRIVLDAPSSLPRSAVTPLAPALAAPSQPEAPAVAVRRQATLAAEAPAARPDGVAAVPTSNTPNLARAAARPALERLAPTASPLRGETGAVQEHSTTVEVSIGRIEVRLPPARGPVAMPTAPPAAPRRTAIGLDEYLQGRDAGKMR